MVSYNFALLTVAVQTPVALLKTHGIPWHFNMDDVAACMLKIQTFCSGICGNHDPRLGRWVVEASLDQCPLILGRASTKCCDGRFLPALVLKPLGDESQSIDILGEDQDPFAIPITFIP